MLSYDSKQMLILHIWFILVIPAYCMIGYIPGSTFGVVNDWEMYIVGILYGLNMGSSLSYARSVYAQFIPFGREAELFALYGLGFLFVSIFFNVSVFVCSCVFY